MMRFNSPDFGVRCSEKKRKRSKTTDKVSYQALQKMRNVKCLAVVLMLLGCSGIVRAEESQSAEHLLAQVQSYYQQGQLDEAESAARRALALIGTSETEQFAQVLNDLAGVLTKKNKFEEAERLYVRSLAIRKKLLGNQNAFVAASYNNLGFLYASQRRLDEALRSYLEAKRIGLKLLEDQVRQGSNKSSADAQAVFAAVSLQLSLVESNLGEIYIEKQQLAAAAPLFRKALERRTQFLSANDVALGISYNNVAYVESAQGSYAEAIPLYEKALSIMEANYGAEHQEVARSLQNLSEACEENGDERRAQELLERAVDIRRKLPKEYEGELNVSLVSLADLYFRKHQLTKADELYTEILSHLSDVEQSEESIAILLSAASVKGETKKYEEAEQLYQRILLLLERSVSERSASIRNTVRSNLAFLLREQGKYEQAEALYREILKGRDLRNPQRVATLEKLSSVLLVEKKYAESERVLLEILKFRDEHEGPELLETLQNLIRVGIEQKKYADAQKYAERARLNAKKYFGQDSLENAEVFELSAELCDRDEAKRLNKNEGYDASCRRDFLKQALEICRKKLSPDDEFVKRLEQKLHP